MPGMMVDVTIQGRDLPPPRVDLATGLGSGYAAKLGATDLREVRWLGPDALSARVPPSLGPGAYDLVVVDPQGRSLGPLPNAYQVGCSDAGDAGDVPDSPDGAEAMDAPDVGDLVFEPVDVCAPDSPPLLVFSDSFDTRMAAWTSDGNGTFNILGGVLSIVGNTGASGIGTDLWLVPHTASCSDNFRVETSLRFDSFDATATSATAGVLLRINGNAIGGPGDRNDQYYSCSIDAVTQRVLIEIHGPVPGVVTPLATSATAIPGFGTGMWFSLRGVVNASDLVCEVFMPPPTITVTVPSSAYATGTWGVRVLEASATFEQIGAWSPP